MHTETLHHAQKLSLQTPYFTTSETYGRRARGGEIVSILREGDPASPPRVIELKSGLSPHEMESAMLAAVRLADAGHRVLAFYLVEMKDAGYYSLLAHPTIEAFAEAKLGISRALCMRLVRAGRELLDLKHIDHAFRHGEIAWSKVVLLLSVAVAANEEEWLRATRDLSQRQVMRLVRGLKKGSSPNSRRKGLPDVYVTVRARMTAANRQKLELAQQKLSAMHGQSISLTETLVELAEQALTTRPDGSIPGFESVDHSLYTVIVTRSPGEPASILTDDGPVALDPHTARDLIGQCDIVDLTDLESHAAPDGAPTPSALRRLVLARDGNRCTACGSRVRLNAHHIIWRSKGGPTTAANQTTLCDRCHALVHAGLLFVEGQAPDVRFTDAAGHPLDAQAIAKIPVIELAPLPSRGAFESPRGDSKNSSQLVQNQGLTNSTVEHPDGQTASPRTTFADIVGQSRVLANLKIAAQAARFRGGAVGHVLLTGNPGLGKTSLAMALATELGVPCHPISGPLLADIDALHFALATLSNGAILFIDEVHAVPRRVLEALYEAMESRPFTLVAATTDPDACPEAFRSRFVMREHLDPYTESELTEIATRAAANMALTLDPTAATILAAASRGTPRRTISLLKRARDLAQSTATNHIDSTTATRTHAHMGIDDAGLDPIERRALEVLRSSRRPVSAPRLARLASVSLNEWLQEHELHLLNLGLLEITPRGRVAS